MLCIVLKYLKKYFFNEQKSYKINLRLRPKPKINIAGHKLNTQLSLLHLKKIWLRNVNAAAVLPRPIYRLVGRYLSTTIQINLVLALGNRFKNYLLYALLYIHIYLCDSSKSNNSNIDGIFKGEVMCTSKSSLESIKIYYLCACSVLTILL